MEGGLSGQKCSEWQFSYPFILSLYTTQLEMIYRKNVGTQCETVSEQFDDQGMRGSRINFRELEYPRRGWERSQNRRLCLDLIVIIWQHSRIKMNSMWRIQNKFLDMSEFFLVQAAEAAANDTEDTPKSQAQKEPIQIEQVVLVQKVSIPFQEEASSWNLPAQQPNEPNHKDQTIVEEEEESEQPSQEAPESQQPQQISNSHGQSVVGNDLMLPTENTELMDSLPERGQPIERKMSLHEFIAAEEMMRALQVDAEQFPNINSEYLPKQLQTELEGMCYNSVQAGSYDPNSPLAKFFKESRQDKLNRFLKKRLLRNWGKKINYLCRKQVADSRLRIKGRFVTREQANTILGRDVSQLPVEEIKALLNAKLNQKEDLSEGNDLANLNSMRV